MGSKQTEILEIGGITMAAGKRTSAARKTAGIKGKRITAKQRVARRRNIAVARSYKKRVGAKKLNPKVGKGKNARRGRDFSTSRRTIETSASGRKAYGKAYKKAYQSARASGKRKSSARDAGMKAGYGANKKTGKYKANRFTAKSIEKRGGGPFKGNMFHGGGRMESAVRSKLRKLRIPTHY